MTITWRPCAGCATLIPIDERQASKPSYCPACGAALGPARTASPTARWFYACGKQKLGPCDLQELWRLAGDGKLRPSDMVLREGDKKWAAARTVPGLFVGPTPKKRPETPDAAPAIGPKVNATNGPPSRPVLKRPWGRALAGAAGAAVLVLLGCFVWFWAAGRKDMMPEEVTAKVRPSVALIKNRRWSGSGFLVEGGLVVTNSHVVADDMVAGQVVTFPSSDYRDRQFKVRLVYEDRERDLAVLQLLGALTLPPLQLCSTTLADGEDVLAIGSPGVPGIEGGVSTNSTDKGTLGNARFRYEKDGLVYLQHSARINHGNSGGPLLNMRAEVIGVNVMRITEGEEGPIEGMNLAIPVDDLREIVAKAKARHAAQIDHANLAHDAFSTAANLERAVACYHEAAVFCIRQAEDERKQGRDPTKAYADACRAVTAGRTNVSDPIRNRLQCVEPEWSDITELLAGPALNDRMLGKLPQLRDAYLKVKNLYEAPPTLDELIPQWSVIDDSFPTLREAIDAEFPSVF